MKSKQQQQHPSEPSVTLGLRNVEDLNWDIQQVKLGAGGCLGRIAVGHSQVRTSQGCQAQGRDRGFGGLGPHRFPLAWRWLWDY